MSAEADANGSLLGFGAVDTIGAGACLAATGYGLLAGAANGSPVLKAPIGLLAGIAGAFEVYC